MRLTLRQLQIFRAVAETGSTVAAADRVALSQSATSVALAELERALDARLFDRIGRRLLLNDRGRALLPAAVALLDDARDIEAAFGGAGRPDLRLAASTTIGNYVLPGLLAGFRAQWPEARLGLRVGNTLEVVNAVTAFEVDLGFIEGPCRADAVTVIPWRQDELVVVAAPTHPLARSAAQGRLPLRRLREVRWLLREPGSGTREAVEQALLPHLDHLPADMTLGSSEAIKYAVAEGLGVSCLSRSVVRDLLDLGRLVVLPTTLPRLSRPFSFVHHEKKRLSEALQAFLAHCIG
ncbi:LysR family transcriptional regulator [Dokdonella koreensis]|uniref:LysR family transcriptional regulator n=1 Tax=Dokdonella koreensis DS-123 TaxID=1300342 RepID=A0A160DXW2_9GAMM|nr:LysR family transcriptional regulator [Dokdonella koreensis]ANB19588.1 LysR family transcriptional regulator [Dokdonella koreensis DS-123]